MHIMLRILLYSYTVLSLVVLEENKFKHQLFMIEYINIVSIRQARVKNHTSIYMCCQVIGIRFCVESKYLDISSCSPWLSQSICNLRYCSLHRYNGFPRFRP